MTTLPAPAILLSSADTGEHEQEYVLRAIKPGRVAASPDLTAFEEDFAHRVSVRNAVEVTSGKAASHPTLGSLGFGPVDVAPVSTFSFAATVNAFRHVRAEPHFVDCDEETGNISPVLLEQAHAECRHLGEVRRQSFRSTCSTGASTTAQFSPSLTRVACGFWLTPPTRSEQPITASRSVPPGTRLRSRSTETMMNTLRGDVPLTRYTALAAHVKQVAIQVSERTQHYEHIEVGHHYNFRNTLADFGRAQLARLDDVLSRRDKRRSFEPAPSIGAAALVLQELTVRRASWGRGGSTVTRVVAADVTFKGCLRNE